MPRLHSPGRRRAIAALTAVPMAASTATAYAATLDTDVLLSSVVASPDTVSVGNNAFQIKVWATGNLPSNVNTTGVATITNVYNMATNGTITPGVTTTTVTFSTNYNYSQCPTTGTIPQGCAGNPFVVNATLVVAAGTPGGTTGTVTAAMTGSTGLAADPTPDTGYVKVAANADTIDPVMTLVSVLPAANSNGWNNTDVTVKWSCTDNVGVDYSKSLLEVTLSGEGASQTAEGYCTDTSGNKVTASTGPINIDKTAPTITAEVSPDASSTGWWNIATGAPTVTYTCSDTLSGIDTCSAEHTFAEGASQTDTGTALDKAGNSNTATVSSIDVDLTAPTIDSWTGGPANGGTYYFGNVPAAPTCSASDALSGLNDAGCSVGGYSTAVGTHTLTATATDEAGNKTEETRTYEVKAWTLYGFYQPVDMAGVWNVVKSGSTVPLKFEVFAGQDELTSTSVVKSFSATPVNCDATGVSDEVEITTTGGTSLRYDGTAGQFIQNWQTPKGKAGFCYIVKMTTQDGSSLSANFKLK